jgi:hypothetical protein
VTAVVVLLALAVVALVGALCVLVSAQGRERREWAQERRQLVDRAIAQHTGEVIALDRAQKPKPMRDHEPVIVEGLH